MRFRATVGVLALALVSAAAGAGELVDRIVAIIDRDVVTLSEAERRRAVLDLRGAAERTITDVVERMIEARLIEREVSRFVTEPVPEAEVREALEAVRRQYESEADYERMLKERGIREEDVATELERQLEVNRYLERRFRALTYVTDEEAERYFEEEVLPTLRTERPPTGDELDQIRHILEEQQFNDRIERWIDELKERSVIRRYVW